MHEGTSSPGGTEEQARAPGAGDPAATPRRPRRVRILDAQERAERAERSTYRAKGAMRDWYRRQQARLHKARSGSVRHLLDLRRQVRLKPPILPAVEAFPIRRPGVKLDADASFASSVSKFLLAWVTLVCLVWKRDGLIGSRADLAELLRCSISTVDNHRQALEKMGWLERVRRFRPWKGGFIARNGKQLHNPETTYVLRPGRLLRQAFFQEGAQRGRARREQQSERQRAAGARPPAPVAGSPTAPAPAPEPVQTTSGWDAVTAPVAGTGSQEEDPSALGSIGDQKNTVPAPVPTPPVDNSPHSAAPVDLGGHRGTNDAQSPTAPPPPVADSRARGSAASHPQETAKRAGRGCAFDQVQGEENRSSPVAPAPSRGVETTAPGPQSPLPSEDVLAQLAGSLLPLIGTPEALEAHGLVEQAQRELSRGRQSEARHSLLEASRWLDQAARTRERAGWIAARLLLDEVLGREAGP